mmetsp:Transcript_55331/g.119008  ORF Transcript_55331/g.119008 Transcript_55331/m.119008 type:complete len:129 (-) Transcript_55331:213-599(-)
MVGMDCGTADAKGFGATEAKGLTPDCCSVLTGGPGDACIDCMVMGGDTDCIDMGAVIDCVDCMGIIPIDGMGPPMDMDCATPGIDMECMDDKGTCEALTDRKEPGGVKVPRGTAKVVPTGAEDIDLII